MGWAVDTVYDMQDEMDKANHDDETWRTSLIHPEQKHK
jgi:hypothetical protein